MTPYPQYKPSGISWIGQIPKHWEVKKLKYVGDALIGITYTPNDVAQDEDGLLVLRSSNIQNGRLSFDDNVYVRKDVSDKHIVKQGDILICARNGSAHLVGKCAYIDEANTGYTFGAFMSVFRSSTGKFLYYFFNSEIFKAQTGLFSTSTINQLTSETLNNLLAAIPPLPEQNAIAQYLDEKTALLDKLIANKQQLITLLKEERTALINEAVNGQGKNWERKKLKYVIRDFESGVSVNAVDVPVDSPDDVGVLKTSCVYNYVFEPQENKRVIKEEISRVSCPVKRNSIIISRMNTPDLVGASGFVEVDHPNLFLPDRLWQTVLHKDVELNVKWLSYLFVSNFFRQEMTSKATGTSSSMKNISKSDVLDIDIFIPTITEQSSIVSHIQTHTQRIDGTIAKIEKEIELLQEYKTALISEVVTGKVKVV